jgi:hypothetical protein
LKVDPVGDLTYVGLDEDCASGDGDVGFKLAECLGEESSLAGETICSANRSESDRGNRKGKITLFLDEPLPPAFSLSLSAFF